MSKWIFYNLAIVLMILFQTEALQIGDSCFAQPLVQITPNKTIHFGTSFKGNFSQCADYCRRHCMHLVSINSANENNAIVNYIKTSAYKNEDFWTSGNDLGEEGVFTWASIGERLSYSNWSKNNPNNAMRNGVGENCLHLWVSEEHQWNDHICTQKMYFIREINF